MTIKAKFPGGYGARQEGQFTVWSMRDRTRGWPPAGPRAITFLVSPFSMAIRLLAVVLACGDRGGVVVAVGADGAGVRVVGEDGTAAAQLVDQASGVSRDGDVDRAGIVVRAVAGEEDGQGGQVRQDLVFADVGVFRMPGAGRVALVWPWLHRSAGLPLDQADSSLRPHRPHASSPASR